MKLKKSLIVNFHFGAVWDVVLMVKEKQK
jgi:hypothetical protein